MRTGEEMRRRKPALRASTEKGRGECIKNKKHEADSRSGIQIETADGGRVGWL
jgi:hypothetical protein